MSRADGARRRRRIGAPVLLPALAGVIAAAVAIPIFAFGQGGDGKSIEVATGDSVGFVDVQTNRLVADVPVGTTPTAVISAAGAIWVTNTADGTVDRIDPGTHTIRQTVSVGNGPSGIAFGDGSVWVTNGLSGTVSRISPGTNRVVETIDVGNGPAGILYASGSIWVANTGDDTITRIDPDERPARQDPERRRDRARLRRRHALGQPEDGQSGRAHRSGDGRRAVDRGRQRAHGHRVR